MSDSVTNEYSAEIKDGEMNNSYSYNKNNTEEAAKNESNSFDNVHEPTTPKSPHRRPLPQNIQEEHDRDSFRRTMPIFQIPHVSETALNLKKKALKLEPLANLEDDIYTQIIYSLSEDRKEKIQQHKFKEGADINRAIEHVKDFQLKSMKQNVTNAVKTNVKERDQALNKELDDFDKETQRLKKELEGKQAENRKALKEKHEMELDEHERTWNGEKMAKMFNHASSTLTTLRKQMTSLLLQCRFEEAGQIEQIANEQKAREEVANHEVMQTRFDESQKLLLDRQANELAAFDEDCQIAIKKFYNMRARLRRPLENKELRIEFAKTNAEDKERVWNKARMKRTMDNTITRSTTITPSNRLTRKDIEKTDYELLSLPPLKSNRKKSRKQKSSEKTE